MERRDPEIDAWLADAGIVVEINNKDDGIIKQPIGSLTHSRPGAQLSSFATSRPQQQRVAQNKFGVGMSQVLNSGVTSDRNYAHSANSSSGLSHFTGSGRTLGGDSSALEKSMKRKRKMGDEEEVLLELKSKQANNATTKKTIILPRTESNNRTKKKTTLRTASHQVDEDDNDDNEGRSSVAVLR
jgi:hypothetical protein